MLCVTNAAITNQTKRRSTQVNSKTLPTETTPYAKGYGTKVLIVREYTNPSQYTIRAAKNPIIADSTNRSNGSLVSTFCYVVSPSKNQVKNVIPRITKENAFHVA